MNLKFVAAMLLTMLTVPFVGAQAFANSFPQPSNSRVVELKLSDLRSAYLIRAGVVRYDVSAHSQDEIRAQLQQHFDVVIGLLLVSTLHSIETALARLETADGHHWSDAERAGWRQKLLATRNMQLLRLATYRDRGTFPLNEGQASQPVPIFVDEHDTACAVGHLMRLSGWTDEVDSIHNANNLVYVPDAPRSALASWVLTSGLTFEEAALIQPGYSYPVEFLLTDHSPGVSPIVKNGLRFSNFEMETQNYNADASSMSSLCNFAPSVCTIEVFTQFGMLIPTLDGSLPDPSKVGALIGAGNPPFPAGYTNPGNVWIGIGGTIAPAPSFIDLDIQGSAILGRAQRITIEFDISTVSPNDVMTLLAQQTNSFRGGFVPTTGFPPVPSVGSAMFFMTSRLRTDQGVIASTTLDRYTPADSDNFWVNTSTVNFAPLYQAHMETDLWVLNGVRVDGYVVDFNVVSIPEPGTRFLLGSLSILLAVRRRSRHTPSNFAVASQ